MHFWMSEQDLYKHAKSTVGFLKDVADRLDTNANQINFYSVWKNTDISQDVTHFNIAWSGEPQNCNTEDYDVNLIMEETNYEKRIVFFPLFLFESYYQDFWSLYKATRPYKEHENFCCFAVSNSTCEIRNRVFMQLSQYKHVISFGRFWNNIGYHIPIDEHQVSNIKKFNCKFMLCFENTSKPYYLTEKLQNAWVSGCIPIYWGCTKVTEWLNPKAFLYLEDTTNEAVDRLIKRIIELDNNHEKYMEMYNQPLIIGGIPYDFSLDKICQDINMILKQSGKCA